MTEYRYMMGFSRPSFDLKSGTNILIVSDDGEVYLCSLDTITVDGVAASGGTPVCCFQIFNVLAIGDIYDMYISRRLLFFS